MRWIVWPVAGDDAQPDHVLVLAEEVTTRLRDEQRVGESRKMEAVGRLVGGVAHDFNNLLTGVTLYCDLLLASLEPAHRLRHYVEEIRAAGDQAAGLIRQLLAMAGPQDMEPRVLSLNGIVDAMGNLLTRLIGENIALTFHLDPDLGEVKMDPAQAQQILLNLVLNARDALPEGGQISVETRNAKTAAQDHEPSTSPGILLVVSDNGHGMDAETQTHLFEPFFTTKAAGKGNGLGLATVYSIVERSGGRIHVDSVPGGGTSVTVQLPQFSERQVSGTLISKPGT